MDLPGQPDVVEPYEIISFDWQMPGLDGIKPPSAFLRCLTSLSPPIS